MGSQADAAGEKPDLSNLGYTPTVKVQGEWQVEKVLDKIPDAPSTTTASPIAFFHMIERLKTTKREGWRRFGIDRGESIADHMYRMSIISMFAPPDLANRLDLQRCMKMCLIHDMAELLVGDITPVDGVPKPEKNRRESVTMDYLTRSILSGSDADVGAELRAIWDEYEDSKTLESQYVHDVDKMELLLQMVEYEKRAEGTLDLGEFSWVARKITLPETKAWAAELLQERERFWGGVKHTDGEKGVDGGVSAEMERLQDQYYARD